MMQTCACIFTSNCTFHLLRHLIIFTMRLWVIFWLSSWNFIFWVILPTLSPFFSSSILLYVHLLDVNMIFSYYYFLRWIWMGSFWMIISLSLRILGNFFEVILKFRGNYNGRCYMIIMIGIDLCVIQVEDKIPSI